MNISPKVTGMIGAGLLATGVIAALVGGCALHTLAHRVAVGLITSGTLVGIGGAITTIWAVKKHFFSPTEQVRNEEEGNHGNRYILDQDTIDKIKKTKKGKKKQESFDDRRFRDLSVYGQI